MSTRSFLSLAGAVCALLALPAAAQESGQGAATSGSASIDTVVATVNGTDITLGHMIALRERLPQRYDQLPPEALFSGVLDQLVQQQALASRVEETPPSVALTLDNERRALLSNEALSGTVDQAVSEAALRAAYEDTYGGAEPQTQYNAAHILVDTEAEAQAIIDELEGGADFAALARERSTGPSASQGGDLDWFGAGEMVPAFEEVVADLAPGEVSAPVQTQFGWHVVKLNDTREQQPPAFEEVRDQLAQQLRRQAVTEAVDAAVQAADVAREDTSGIDPAVLNQPGRLD